MFAALTHPERPVWNSFETIDEAKLNAIWGTYGKHGAKHCGGNCPLHQLRWVRLVDCETPHLFAILSTQPQIRDTQYPTIITAILKDRGYTMKQISDTLESIESV